MRIRLPLILSSLAIAAASQAWGPVGHRQIADIAWSQLTHDTKVAIAKILMAGDTVNARGQDQVFSVPNQEITDSFLEQTVRPVFADAANWCDVIKGGKSKLFEDRITQDNVNSPGVHPPASGTSGEEARCKTWHYYDKPINAPGEKDPHAARESNAVRAMALCMKEFGAQAKSSNPDRASQVYNLYWIEHVFGDLHQPLHCVSDFTRNPKGDDGGNGFKLGINSPYGNGGKWNLHGYWDSGVDHAIAADPKLGKPMPAPEVTAAWLTETAFLPAAADVKNLEIMTWIDRGWQLAVDNVYKGVEPDGAPGQGYESAHADICKRQALLGGFRLAEYLNRTLGKQ